MSEEFTPVVEWIREQVQVWLEEEKRIMENNEAEKLYLVILEEPNGAYTVIGAFEKIESAATYIYNNTPPPRCEYVIGNVFVMDDRGDGVEENEDSSWGYSSTKLLAEVSAGDRIRTNDGGLYEVHAAARVTWGGHVLLVTPFLSPGHKIVLRFGRNAVVEMPWSMCCRRAPADEGEVGPGEVHRGPHQRVCSRRCRPVP